jgi:O-acetyl-ADP-ribose deacetylase (regulator of RNase III)
MRTEIGNILTVDRGIICHQVNCKGVMGAGIALQIRNKWPKAYLDYREAYNSGRLQPGRVVTSRVRSRPSLFVAHLCGQDGYGREPGKVYTNYTALATCLALVAAARQPTYVPHGMGCGNAGGDWQVVSSLVEMLIPHAVIMKLS